MSKRQPRLLLLDILENASLILEQTSGLGFEQFLDDTKTKNACLFCLVVIGEAAGNLSDEFRSENHQIPWLKIRALRNHLAHGYFIIDYDLVWNVIRTEIPKLKSEIESLLKQLE